MRNNSLELLESRRMLSGAIDSTFGAGGKVTGHAAIPASGFTLPTVTDLALLSGGKSLAVGNLSLNGGHVAFVARYKGDGSLDTTYGTDGYTTVNFGGSDSVANAIVIDSSGRAVIAGYSVNSGGTKTSFALARLTITGKLDSSFSGDGLVVTNFTEKTAIANDLAVGADGKLVAAGYSANGAGTAKFAVARYKTDGSLDKGFSVDGLQTIDLGVGNDVANSVAVLNDGRVVLAGYFTDLNNSNFAVVRLTNTGQRDNSFGGNGIAAVDLGGNEQASSLLLDGDKYVIGGTRDRIEDESDSLDVAVVRLGDGGAIDNTFIGTDEILTNSAGQPKVIIAAGANNTYRVFYTYFGANELVVSKSAEIIKHNTGSFLPFDEDPAIAELAAVQTRSDGSAVLAVNADNHSVGIESFPIHFIQIDPINADGTRPATRLSGPFFPRVVSNAAVTLDGKLALVGLSQFDYLFYRFNSDGKPDTSFAGDGRSEVLNVTSALLGSPNLFIMPDGALVGYGTDRDGADPDPIAVVMRRVLADGTVDEHFANDHTTWGLIADESGGADVTLLPRGAIAVTYDQFTTGNRWAVIVLPDRSVVNARIPGEGYVEENHLPNAVRPIGDSGAFFATGVAMDDEAHDFRTARAIAKYGADFELDTAYGQGGVVFGSFDLVLAQADGKFLYRAPNSGLKRRDTAGALDMSFGVNGVAASGYTNFVFDSMDRIIAWKKLTNGDIQVARFTPEGKTDSQFGTNGVVKVHPTVAGDIAVSIDANDNIVVNTLKKNSTSYDWFATRLTGGGFAELVNGELSISGSSRDDSISLSVSGSLINVTVNGKSKSFSKSQVTSVDINAFGGTDVVNISSKITLGVKVDAGDGNDQISGGAGNDSLFGGLGRDAILGHDGNDKIDVGAADDYMEGGKGNDTLIGGAGNDVLDGGAGNDSLSGGDGNDTFFAKEGQKDSLDGGGGSDKAKRDNSASVKDSVLSIESFI